MPFTSTPGSDRASAASGTLTGVVAAAILLGVAALVCWLVVGTFDMLSLSNDGAQYLSAARNLFDGNGLRTSTLYYESQLIAQAPAPLVTWPPGFPMITAAVAALTDWPVVDAARVVPLLGHLCVGFLLCAIIRSLGFGWLLAVSVGVTWMLSVRGWVGAIQGTSDALMTFFVMLAAFCLARSARDHAAVRWWLAGAALAACGGVLVRYQSVSLILPLILAAVLGSRRHGYLDRRDVLRALAVSVLPGIVLLMLLVRNALLSGVLTGGAITDRGTPFFHIARNINWIPGLPVPLRSALLIVTGIVCVVLILESLRLSYKELRRRPDAEGSGPPTLVIVATFGFLSVGLNFLLMLVLSLRSTSYSIDTRVMLSMMPVLTISVLAWLRLTFRDRGRRNLILMESPIALLLLGLACIQANTLYEDYFLRLARESRVSKISEILRENRMPSGQTLATLLDTGRPGHAGRASCILSNEAQQLALISTQVLVGIPRRAMTNRDWSADEMEALARRHGCRHVLVFKDLQVDPGDQIRRILASSTDQKWLNPLVDAPDVFAAEIAEVSEMESR